MIDAGSGLGGRAPALDAAAAVIIATMVGLPLFLPLPGFEAVPILAQVLSVVAVFVVLPPQLAADATGLRMGSEVRLAVLTMGLTAFLAWLAGSVVHGPTMSSLLSLLNWIALGALVVCGQAFLGRADRAELLLLIWSWSYACVAVGIMAYLMLRFGTALIVSTDRGPFQLAVRAIFPTWPNYFGTALAVGVCYPFARLLTGRSGPAVWVALPILLVTLLVTFSRTAIAVTAVALFVMALAGGRARKMLPVALATVIVLASVAAFLPAVGFQFSETLRPGSSQQLGVFERYAYAAEAVRLWQQHPLFGIGFGRFDEFAELPRIIQRAGFEGVTLGSVHNEYVTTLLKGGLLGIVGFLLVLVVSIGGFQRARRSADPGVRVLGLTGIGIAAVLGLAGLAAETFRTLSVAGPFWVLAGSVSVICARGTGLEALPRDGGETAS